MDKLNPIEVAIKQAESLLPLAGAAFESAVIERPDTATDSEHLQALVTVTEGAIAMLSAFLTQWKVSLERKHNV